MFTQGGVPASDGLVCLRYTYPPLTRTHISGLSVLSLLVFSDAMETLEKVDGVEGSLMPNLAPTCDNHMRSFKIIGKYSPEQTC